MAQTRIERARRVADGRPLLSSNLATVTWLTGLVTDIEIGPSPFSVSPLVVVAPDGSAKVVASEDEAGELAQGVEALTFPGFAVEDVDRAAAASSLALDAVGAAPSVAVELASLPGSLTVALLGQGVELVDVSAELRRERAVKDPDEIEGLRAAIRIADAGQAEAREALKAGRSELEVWTDVRLAMERAAGGRIPVLADLVTGERTAEIGGPPSLRTVAEADLLLVDLVPRVGAYWADSCATVALGEPSDEVRRAHETALAALNRALGLVRPGASAADVDAAARGVVEGAGGSYPHHTGHGLGVTAHEEPRVIPGSERTFEAGMVVALEPGWYGDGWGVRVEHVALVTPDGAEVLSGHSLEL